jgi:hypothetical protein
MRASSTGDSTMHGPDSDVSPMNAPRVAPVIDAEPQGADDALASDRFAPTLDRMRRLDSVLEPAPGCEQGIRLQFGRGPRLDCLDLADDPAAAVVLGRHEACSFRVDGGKAIASRHALLVPRREPEGVVLEIIDLGRRPLPGEVTIDPSDPGEHVLAFGEGLLRVHSMVAGERVSVRVHRARPMHGREFTLGLEPGFPIDRRPDGSRDACVAQVALDRGGVRVARWMRERELSEGLLLRRDPGGEADSELEPGPWVEEDADPTARLFARLTRRLSRAHLLLRQEPRLQSDQAPALVVYDLDSSPGSFWHDQSIHRLALPPQRIRLQLGNPHTGVQLQISPR